VFDACKELTGATAGYVALLTDDGAENEVLFLDAGGMPCTVDPKLPMPIRGLRSESYRLNRAVYDNDFMNSKWVEFMPSGHVAMRNVLFAPLIIGEKAVGLIGLANKDGDFTDHDAAMATGFGELASLALRRTRDEDKVRQSKDEAERYARQLQELRAKTDRDEELSRRQAATRLHDAVSSNLTAIGIMLEDIRLRASEQLCSEVAGKLAEAEALLHESSAQSYGLMMSLHPASLDDFGVVSALRWYSAQLAQTSELSIHIEGEDPDPRLPAEHELALYRIAQEALLSAIRHAKAHTATITLASTDDAVRMAVRDDGVGVDDAMVQDPGAHGGWGLLSMRERAGRIGACLELESSPDRGTCVSVEVRR